MSAPSIRLDLLRPRLSLVKPLRYETPAQAGTEAGEIEAVNFMAKPTRETTIGKTPYDLARIVARALGSDASESAKQALAELHELAAENRSDDDQTDDTSTLLSEKRRGRKADSLRKDVGVDNERTPVRHDKRRVPAGHQVVQGKRGQFLAADWLDFDSDGELVDDAELETKTHELAYACHRLLSRLPIEDWKADGVAAHDASLLKLVYRTVFGFEAGLDMLWIERLSVALHVNAGNAERRRFEGLSPLDARETAEKILIKLKNHAILGEGKRAPVTIPDELTVDAVTHLIGIVGYGSGGKYGKRDARKVVTEFASALKSRRNVVKFDT